MPEPDDDAPAPAADDFPDFVTVGHATRDLVPGGSRLGGTVTFAAVQAHRFGCSVGVVTRAAADLDVAGELPFASVVQLSSSETSTFENIYRGGEREQYIRARGDAIGRDDVPVAWRASPIILLGPVAGEIAPDFAGVFTEASIVGVSAQGWLRSIADDGRVLHSAWGGEPFWRDCYVLFVSDEDLVEGGGREELERWCAEVPIVAMTESWRGLRVHYRGAWRRMDAFPEQEVDPTGAGDTFATGFLIRLHETGDVDEAARFGAAAASLSVGGIAAAAMPTRAEVEARMRAYPEIALR